MTQKNDVVGESYKILESLSNRFKIAPDNIVETTDLNSTHLGPKKYIYICALLRVFPDVNSSFLTSTLNDKPRKSLILI